MDAYMYRAALYSGAGLIAMLILDGKASPAARDMGVEDVLEQVFGAAGVDREDESSFDSDDLPKGPFKDGGGEADTPQHCSGTNEFLDNPLTEDGERYVMEQLEEAGRFIHDESPTNLSGVRWEANPDTDAHKASVLGQWWDAYGSSLNTKVGEIDGLPE